MKLFQRGVDLNDPVLRAGYYTLSAGLVSIRYETGVELLIEAPAKFQLDSKQRVTLESGQIAANVPPEGVEFTIETPSAEVIDYGTEFAVGVGRDGASEVHVFQGEVEVQPRMEQSEPVRLFTHAATRVEMESSVPMGIELDETRFLRSLDEPVLRHSRLVQSLDPSLYFRMGVPKDGVTMRDKAGESDGEIVDRGAKRPPFSPGKVGSSVRFDGPSKGAYVRVSDFPKPEGGYLSLSCWIKAASLPRRGTIVSNASLSQKGIFEAGLLRDSGKVFVGVRPEGSDDLVEVRSSDPLQLQNWVHFAFVADGEKLRLFLDGIEIASAECGPVSTASNAFLGIGARINERNKTADQFWHGRIDEFALFNHALSESDILTLYQNSDLVEK
ncbi:MAG: LamG-like jellyroll fold domain-containing protein [Verrucomicrobiota bacterium]